MPTPEISTNDPSVPVTNHKPKPGKGPLALLVATRKGAFILRGGKSRRRWKLSDPIFLGQMVHHMVQDPREPQTILKCW